MKKNVIFVFFTAVLVISMGVVYPAHASPAAPSFFEGISEWFGDVFTFGNLAKAERNIQKAEAIFQDLSNNSPKDDSLNAFFKQGLTRYEERVLNAKFHLENAKQKGKDVSSLGKTIADVTDNHTRILE